MVIRRVEVPKVEYSFDAAVNLVIELNKIYNPSFIYADRGSGEYQIEVLHKYGEEHPESGLKNKLKGFQFSQKLEITDPVTKRITKESMKPFMVNQLAMIIERDQLIMSPFDETLHKQLVDYEVEKISASGQPIFTSENEHFVDALGLAILAFALEFPDITKTIEKVQYTNVIESTQTNIIKDKISKVLHSVNSSGFGSVNPWKNLQNGTFTPEIANDPNERDVPKWFKADPPASFRGMISKPTSGWGSRSASFGRGNGLRRSW